MNKSKKVCSYTLMETTDEMLRKHLADKPTSMSAFVDIAIREKVEREQKNHE